MKKLYDILGTVVSWILGIIAFAFYGIMSIGGCVIQIVLFLLALVIGGWVVRLLIGFVVGLF